jgi:hypothetical protein
MDTKCCAKCKEELTIDNFSKDSQKKDGLRNYCKECEKKIKAKSKFKKEMGFVEDTASVIVSPPDEKKLPQEEAEKEVDKYNTDVKYLAKLVARQYGQDLVRADEVYDLFYNKIAGGDNTQASKEALTKSLELRMSASTSILKLIEAASKIQKEREKSKKYNLDSLKNGFKL